MMMSTSQSGRLIRYLEHTLAPFLQMQGFSPQGRLFRRASQGVIHLVEARLLRDAPPEAPRFTLEFGVCFPSLLAALARMQAFSHLARHVDKPNIQSCALRRSAADLQGPSRMLDWPLDPGADHAVVLTLLEQQGLPWLEQASSLSALAGGQHLDDGLASRLMQALACLQLGWDNRALETCLNHADGRYPADLAAARQWAAELYNQLACALQPRPDGLLTP